MLQLWTVSNLQKLDYSIRKKVYFYAPLTESLDFMGIDPFTYSYSGSVPNVGFRGGVRTVTMPTPLFGWSGDTPSGLKVDTGITFRFNAANILNDANTLVWFENRVPKSTPTQSPPFDNNGNWVGTLGVFISHIAKANAVLANSEINAIQTALLDVAQVIPTPPVPPIGLSGAPVTETPGGARNGSNKVFTLSQAPDLGSLEVFWAGLYLKRVASAPDTLEYMTSGADNQTLILGSAPQANEDISAVYWIIA